MASEGTVAPKERVNIVYKPATGDAQEEVELPLKMLMMGDYTGRSDGQPLEERKPVNIDKDNFGEVMTSQNINLAMSVQDKLSKEGGEIPISLNFKDINAFGPESVAEQVPQMKALLDLRKALTALKGPLGNSAAFRKKIQNLISDPKSRGQLIKELNLKSDESA